MPKSTKVTPPSTKKVVWLKMGNVVVGVSVSLLFPTTTTEVVVVVVVVSGVISDGLLVSSTLAQLTQNNTNHRVCKTQGVFFCSAAKFQSRRGNGHGRLKKIDACWTRTKRIKEEDDDDSTPRVAFLASMIINLFSATSKSPSDPALRFNDNRFLMWFMRYRRSPTKCYTDTPTGY
jgi:hypothetical protein